MKTSYLIPAALLAALAMAPVHADDIKKGDKLQTLSNLHPDMAKRLLYTMNYQQAGLIPVCSDVTVTGISGKKMSFDYKGVDYNIEYEKYTKGAGVSFQDSLKEVFGPACNQAKLKSLSQVDKDGVASGKPKIGMSKDGILFAMGKPPKHATPSLDTDYWLYWENRFGKTGVQFNDKGKVSEIR